MGIWNLRAKVAVLWLVLTLLVVGIVAWAISAEVVMGAMRDAARKSSDISSMRLLQNFDNSDDFSINRINKKVGDSRKSIPKNSETALMREVHKEEIINNGLNGRLKHNNRQFSYDDKHVDDKYISDGEEEDAEESEESLQRVEVMEDKVVTTRKPFSLNLDFDKLRNSLTGAQVAQVIERLMAQRKALNPKESSAPQIVVVAPVVEPSTKKPKVIATSKATKKPTTTTTTTTTTTAKPSTARTTFRPYNRSPIQSLSLKLANSAITTTKPKGIQIKVNTIKLRRTTTTPSTTPSTTTTTTRTTTTTTRKSNVSKKKSRTRKTSAKSSKTNSTKSSTTTTTTPSPSTTISPTQLELLKSKIRQKELEFILNKVESLEKQQKRFLKQSKDQDLLMENSFQENVYKPKPNIEVIPFGKEKYPEYGYPYSSRHNYDMNPSNDNSHKNDQHLDGWQPSPMHPPSHLHPPPPPPPPPPLLNLPPPPNGPNGHNSQQFSSHQMPFQPYIPPPPPNQVYAESQAIPQHHNKPMSEQNMFAMNGNGLQNGKFFNGILPIPNNRAISLGGGEPHMVQESHQMPYRIKPRGHSIQKTEKPGIQLSFGGGPMGGGGQLKTSPMGIFKTLLLPLLPKPRMNLNGKVVFGVVLENGVGFGKKPKIVAQHFSTGHI